MHRRRTDARALVAQILGTMERQPDRLPAINASGRAIAHHANGNLAHDEISRFAPRRLKETKNWNVMIWHKHENRTGGGTGVPTDADVAAVGVEVAGGSEMAERPAPSLTVKRRAWETRSRTHRGSPTGYRRRF